jgi:hypothetical protein
MARSSASNPLNTAPKPEASLTPDIETVKSDAGAVAQEAQSVASQVAAEAGATASQIADEAKAQLAEQAGRLKGMAGEQKDLFADQIGGVAEAMDKVAGELESNDSASARYARMIADNADKVSTTIRENDVDALLGMAQDFGRRQPAAFMGAAALLGFAASRFLMASANRPVASAYDKAEADLGEEGPSYSGTSSAAGTAPFESGRV